MQIRFVARIYWWVLRRVFKPKNVEEIDLLCITLPADADSTHVEHRLREAIHLIRQAGGGFEELVLSHLRLVVVDDVKEPMAHPVPRAYVSSFDGHEARSSEYLACQLIWAATYNRLFWNRQTKGRGDVDHKSLLETGHAAQVRFAQQLPNSEYWVTYLESNNPTK